MMEPTTRLFLAVIPICASTREYRKVICSYLRNLLVVNPDPKFSVSAFEEGSIAEGAVLEENIRQADRSLDNLEVRNGLARGGDGGPQAAPSVRKYVAQKEVEVFIITPVLPCH